MTFTASLGTWGNAVWSAPGPNQVLATMTDGDRCYMQGEWITRTTKYLFTCYSPTQQAITVNEEINTCVFNIVHSVDCQSPPPQMCVFVAPQYKVKYDLNKLRKQSGDYNGTDGTYDYLMNVCGPINTPGVCQRNKQAICQVNKNDHQFSAGLGSFNVEPRESWTLLSTADPTMGVALKFTNGDWCYVGSQRIPRTTMVSFICDPSRPDETVIGVLSNPDSCVYTIKHYSHSACPQPASLVEMLTLPRID